MKALITSVGLALLATLAPLHAQQVQAALAQDTAAVGQPVQLNISITGGRGVNLPERINIEGLDIRHAGETTQTQVNMINGRLNAVNSSIHTYLIIPIKAGEFTIPALSIKVGGKVLQTQPLTLTVGGPPSSSRGGIPVLPAIPVPQGQGNFSNPGIPSTLPTPPPEPEPLTMDQVAFGDLVLPRKTAYVGEVIPVEIRFFFSTEFPVRLQDQPTFSGDGFTVMNFSKPEQREQEIGGRIYNVVSFQTAITPAKAGELEITPAELDSEIRFPDRRSQNMDDFFGGLFGSIGGNFRQVTVKTRPISLEVKPLPKEDRPESFAGAIGQFSIGALADPKKAVAGDPIQLDVTISGRGNFDGMTAPTLIDTEGWRTYPPGENFRPSSSDPIGYNGEKTFEYMILARTNQSFTPMAEFSYFDPELEKYVTLKTPPIAVEVEGGTVPAAAAVAASEPTPEAESAEPSPEDVLSRSFVPAHFRPFVANKTFLVANGVLAVAWLGFLFFGLGRIFTRSRFARESALRREHRKLLSAMEAADCPAEEFYRLAGEFVRARLGSDSPDVVSQAPLRDDTRAGLMALLNQRDETRYSTASAAQIGPEDRRGILTLLKTIDEELS